MNEPNEYSKPLEKSAHGDSDIWAQNVNRLWVEVELLTSGTVANRVASGKRFRELRSLYSDRNFGGRRLTSGHGSFEEEIRRRGYKPRTVRQFIEDYESSLVGKPLSSAKRKARRLNNKPLVSIEPLSAFAALLPFKAAQAAYREAAKLFHPDHGGDQDKMQQLNAIWQQVKAHYNAKNI
jgi:hypothetical protein